MMIKVAWTLHTVLVTIRGLKLHARSKCLACIGGCIDIRAQGNGEPLPVCLCLC